MSRIDAIGSGRLPGVVLCLAGLAAAPPAGQPPLPPPPSLRLGKTDRLLAWHREGVAGVSYSPDGRTIATTGGDFRVRLWDAASGKRVRTFSAHRSFQRVALFSPDGKLIASGGNDREIILWDPATGREVRRLAGHAGQALYTAVFTPDGKTLVSGGFDAQVRVWDVATGKQRRAWPTHQRVVYGVAVSPDGATLATGGDQDSTVRLWDLATGREKRSWSAHNACVWTLAFSPDGRWLASGGGDDLARLWEVATGKEVRRLSGHGGNGAYKVRFSPDGRLLLVACHDRTLLVWELLGGKELCRLGDHRDWVWALARSPDGRSLLSGGHDGTAVVWDLRGRLRRTAAPATLTAEAAEALWANLAGDDAGRAYAAVYGLAAHPARAVPLLRKHLRPASAPRQDPTRVGRLIEDLDSDDFTTRQKASAQLDRLAPGVLPALRKALARPASLEAGRRVARNNPKPDRAPLSTGDLRALRAVQVLEEAGTADARALLRTLARGGADARLTQEARAALARLERSAKQGGR